MANAIYINEGTAKVFAPSGGDVTFTLTSLGAGAGRRSARLDLGVKPRPLRYRLDVSVEANAALTAGAVVLEVYTVGADASTGSTYADGDQTETDAALSNANKRFNLQLIGVVLADSTTNGDDQKATFEFEFTRRYLQLVAYIPSGGVALSATAANQLMRLTPIYREIQ